MPCLNARPERGRTWLADWRAALEVEDGAKGSRDAERLERMKRANPVFVPRNHRVGEAIQAAYVGDYAPFHRLVEVLARPFDEQPEHAELEAAPAPEEVVQRTFCGT